MFKKSFAGVVGALALGLASVAAMAADAPAKSVGGVLVGANGMTLYTFDKDAANSGKSACSGPCATAWPPLMAAAADQPMGSYTIVTRDDGAKQWAYKGKPLYFFQSDKAASDRNGDNFKDVWHVIKE
ncbi:hypothetical protein [Rhodoferax sp.]|uniref:COG4315 family predicted lipoprotein n=1 Tax=Rhodoferax sp. TaxID=50421 RepID=UPI00374D6AFE